MSDQDKDVFGNENDQSQASDTDNANNQEPTQDLFADRLGTILREDGTQKFTDVASALDSIPHADKHITTLESELKEAKESLARETAAKEVLQKAAQTTQPTQQGLTAEQVKEIALQANSEQATANQQEANVNLVREQFSTQFGDKAGEEMDRVASSSGMTKSQLKTLSETSPKAVLQLAGIEIKASPVQKTPYSQGNDLPSPPSKPQPAKSVMSGADTNEMVNAWRGAGERIKQT